MNRRLLSRQRLLGFSLAGVLAIGTLAAMGGQMGPARADAPTPVNCDVDNSQVPWGAEEIQLLKLTNDYRAAHGVAPLEADYVLTQIALWKANNAFDVLRAQGPSGVAHDDPTRTWQQRFQDCTYTVLYPAAFIGENLNGGTETAAATLKDFEGSPLHNKNLLDPDFKTVGIKRVQQPDPLNPNKPFWIWMMTFGSELDRDPLATPVAQSTPDASAAAGSQTSADGTDGSGSQSGSGSADGSSGTGSQGSGDGSGG